MYNEIFKKVGEEQVVLILTNLTLPFTVSRYTVYGEEIVKQPSPYNTIVDMFTIGDFEHNGHNVYYYTIVKDDGNLSNNYTVWKNSIKRYENLQQAYQIPGEENIPVYDNSGEENIPTHPIETRSIEAIKESFVRTDNKHFFINRTDFFPFATDALSFRYTIPDSDVFPGYNELSELTQEEYELLKSDTEQIYNNENNIYNIVGTTNFFHLSSNGINVIETRIDAYGTKPQILYAGDASDYKGSPGNLNDGNLGTETYTVLNWPPSPLTDFWVFNDNMTSASNRRNHNLTFRKSLKGYSELGRFVLNTSTEYPNWNNVFDAGYMEKIYSSYTFYNGVNFTYTRYNKSNFFKIQIIPEMYSFSVEQANIR